MGMYNEALMPCPKCERGIGYMQIPQIVMGFGEFRLNAPESLARKLNTEQMIKLREYVQEDDFVCGGGGLAYPGDGCGHVFNPFTDSRRTELAKFLFPS